MAMTSFLILLIHLTLHHLNFTSLRFQDDEALISGHHDFKRNLWTKDLFYNGHP